MFGFKKISRAQLLAVTGWTSADLDNRVHAKQLALAHGLRLPASTGIYIGLDCFALVLTDALVQGAGFPRSTASRFVLEGHSKWLGGLSRLEWPDAHPPPSPTTHYDWAPTQTGLPPWRETSTDTNIYFAVAWTPSGAYETACGSSAENMRRFLPLMHTIKSPKGAQIGFAGVQEVYDRTLASARSAGVDLGTPFTRPEGHPEYRDWRTAIEVHCALSMQRAKVRKPPGPRAKGKKGKARKFGGQPRATRTKKAKTPAR